MANTKYIPPHLRKCKTELYTPVNRQSDAFQMLNFEKMKNGVNALINKINFDNFLMLLPDFFEINLIRARGIFAQAIVRAQNLAPLKYTRLYCALISVINTKLPENGRLVLVRLISQLRRSIRLNDKQKSISTAIFLAHLINYKVCGEALGLEVLHFLTHYPSDSSVLIAIEFLKQVGQTLELCAPKGLYSIFERLRRISHAGECNNKVLYKLESLFNIRRTNYDNFPRLLFDLDLVADEDQITHDIRLDDADILKQQMTFLNHYWFDPNFEDTENSWNMIKAEVLQDDLSEDELSSVEENLIENKVSGHVSKYENDSIQMSALSEVRHNSLLPKETITNRAKSEIVSLRRVIYLTLMSSLNFEECAHKILKLNIPRESEDEVTCMILDCCSQAKAFEKYFGSIGSRLCQANPKYKISFSRAFQHRLNSSHRLQTTSIENIAKFYAFLMCSDVLNWSSIFEHIRISESATTSSSRIFIKILLQELSKQLGVKYLRDRVFDKNHNIYVSGLENWEDMCDSIIGMFEFNSQSDALFAINFLTVIGLGSLTFKMREYLSNQELRKEKDSTFISNEIEEKSQSKKDTERNCPEYLIKKVLDIDKRQRFISGTS